MTFRSACLVRLVTLIVYLNALRRGLRGAALFQFQHGITAVAGGQVYAAAFHVRSVSANWPYRASYKDCFGARTPRSVGTRPGRRPAAQVVSLLHLLALLQPARPSAKEQEAPIVIVTSGCQNFFISSLPSVLRPWGRSEPGVPARDPSTLARAGNKERPPRGGRSYSRSLFAPVEFAAVANFVLFVVGRRVRRPVGHLRSASQEAGKRREDKEDHERKNSILAIVAAPDDAGKAKDGGDNSDDEKDYCPVKHLHTLDSSQALTGVLLQFRMASDSGSKYWVNLM